MLGVLKGVKDTMNVLKKALEHTREQIEQLEQENSPELPMTQSILYMMSIASTSTSTMPETRSRST